MAEMAREHLVPLWGEWDCWNTAALRSTGFPFGWILRLAREGAPAAFEKLLEAERRRDEQRKAATEEISRRLDEAPPEARRALAKLRDQLGRGAAPSAPPADAALAACAARVKEAEEGAARALEDFRAAHRQDALASQGVLRELAADARFREALTWQNRSALRGSVDAFLRRPPGEADSKTREYERLVARYAQRYCAKNETIGFFGPIAWADVGGGGGLSARTLQPWLRSRRVYFEFWCIDALAESLATGDPALRAELAPRLSPAVRMEGDLLRYGVDRAVPLQPAVRRTLELCDGERSAAAVARAVAGDAALEVTEAEVLELLSDLAQKKAILWTLDVPGSCFPERSLEARLLAMPAGGPRERALEALRELVEARGRVAAAAGDPAALGEALTGLEVRFGELTGRRAQRAEGKSYAGRTLLYEDCVRNVRAQVGRAFLDRIGRPLALVLRSARWFTHQLAVRSEAALLELWREMAAGEKAVRLIPFYERASALFPMNRQRPGPLAAQLLGELQAKWSALLALPPEASRVERAAAELERGAEEASPAPGPGWPDGRLHSPDVMVAARSSEALERGELLAVLGEVHAGTNTLFAPCLLKEHPGPEALQAVKALDVPEVQVEMISAKDQWARTDLVATSPQDIHVETGSGMSWRPRAQVESAADLVVREVDGRIRVESLRTGRSFDSASFFGCVLGFESTSHFHPLPVAPHTPRVTVDGLVIARERWRFEREALAWAALETPADRFLAAQRWARAHGLPRFVFVSMPEEPKPIYLDFHAPALLEVCAQALRKASRASVTEMLPGPSELWLEGADGERHCCELRMVAVDRKRWQG